MARVSWTWPKPARPCGPEASFCDNRSELPVPTGEKDIVTTCLPEVPNIFLISHIQTSWRVGWCARGRTRLPELFSLHVNDVPTLCHHFELAQFAAVIAASDSPSFLLCYLVAYLGRLERELQEQRLPSESQSAPPCSLLRP